MRARLVVAGVVVLLGVFTWWLAPVAFGLNLHAVVPGRVWRAAQPAPEEIARLADELDLRTVVNLRRAEDDEAWLEAERATAAGRGLAHRSVPLSGQSLPAPDVLRDLVHVLADAERPVLLHCEAGVERSGLASAVVLLLEGRPLEEARGQFGARYGYVQALSGSSLPQALDDYEGWLAARGEPHSRERLLAWADDGYVPAFYRARAEVLRPTGPVPAGEPVGLAFRLVNESRAPWRHRADRESGVHVEVRVLRADGRVAARERTGYRDEEVPPGGASTWELELPALEPGAYVLEIAPVDEYVDWFEAQGDPPERVPLTVVGR